MADDDDDVRGGPVPEDLLGPTGPRRSNFTPAPTDAESLEAANNVFGDDAIAAAMAAELARVASGPIPVQKPAETVPSAPVQSAPVESASVPSAPVAPEPIASAPVAPEPVDSEPDDSEPDDSEPEIAGPDVPAPVSSIPVASASFAPEAEAAPEPEPVAAYTPEPAQEPEPSPEPEAAPEPVPEPEAASEPEPVAAPEPEPEPVASAPVAPPGPPDWASSLFGQPTPTVRDETPVPVQDPFAPSAPPFAPSSGPFPPPSEVDGTSGSPVTTDSDALRALYRGAPAPTVPAADAPPPPGYEPPAGEPVDSAPDATDAPPRRLSLDDDELIRTVSDDAGPADTRDAIEQLQAQLHLREQEAREFAVWESSMQAIGTPEALAEVARARAELAGSPGVDAEPVPENVAAPTYDEPAAELPPPAEEPAAEFAPPHADYSAFAPTPVEEPASELPAPAEEPAAFLAPPAEEPAAFLPPPAEEPAAFLPPPAEEPDPFLAPPAQEPAAFLTPPVEEPAAFFAPPVEEPAAFLAPPADEPAAELAPPAEEPAAFLPPPAEELFPTLTPTTELNVPSAPVSEDPYAGFAPPTDDSPAPWDLSVSDLPDSTAGADENPFDVFAKMAEERQANEATATEAPAPPEPEDSPFAGFAPPTTEGAVDTFAAPADPRDLSFDPPPVLPDAPVFIEPPALVEPAPPSDGVADLYRAAGETPPPVAQFDPPPSVEASPPPPPAQDVAAQGVPAAPPGVFDDLLSGSGEPPAPDPGATWIPPDPAAPPAEPGDEAPGGRRPFGEGVERDDAVDPSDSIFGAAPAPVSVNTAGVAVVPAYVALESQPIKIPAPEYAAAVAEPLAPSAPTILPAEPAGLEPTPLEQRVGRSARLFWLWFAANSSIAAIIFGTVIFALGVSLRQAIIATLAGVALSFIPLGLGTLAGKRSGQPTMVISRATFGVVGNILPAILALISRLFWAAALLWILGAGTAEILVGAKLTDGFSSDQLTIIVMALGFIVAVVIAYFGYALIAVTQLVISIVSGITIIGFIALTLQYVNLTTAIATPDGPWILVVTGAVLVFSFVGLAWANSSADVARYQRPDSSGAVSMLWATFGAALPSFVLIGYGALLAASNLTLAENIAANPLDSLGRLLPVWYPAPLLAATGLSLISGIVLAMYSGGFALQAAGLRIRRSLSTVLVGVLVVVIAILIALSVTDFTQLLRDFSTTIAVPIAGWAGIFGAEIMIRNRRFDAQSLLRRGGVYEDARWVNLASLVLVSVVGFGFLSATVPALGWEGYLFTAFGIPLNSVLATSDFGVLVALILGILLPLVVGIPAIRKQERAERPAE